MEENTSVRSQFAETDNAASLQTLVERLVPVVTPGDVETLTRIIRRAQKQPPDKKEQFVQDVNRLLDLSNTRILIETGELARLAVAPGSSRKGYIQFATPRGNRGHFKNSTIELVGVPTNYFPTGQLFTPEV